MAIRINLSSHIYWYEARLEAAKNVRMGKMESLCSQRTKERPGV